MARLIESLKGHQEIWGRLLRDLNLGRLPHAMAFAGDSGVGKKKLSWALAQALVCTAEQRPCGICPACQRVAAEQSESVLFVEPEKGTIKLEAAERILEFLNLRLLGKARVILIDQAHLLNPQTGNALLKVIEEPPANTFFILIVNELGQLLPTLRSRVQVLRFSPLSEDELRAAANTEDWPKWKLRAARGSLQRLDAFTNEASDELRALTLEFLIRALGGERVGLDKILDHTKDRGDALRALGFLQQVLRDWSVLDAAPLVNSDLEKDLRALPALDTERKLELWTRAFAMETDFIAHVDRNLLFENFFHLARGN